MCATANELEVAFFQQDIVWESPEENYRRVEDAFQNARADILVVPETFSTGFGNNMAAMAEDPRGETYHFAVSMARQHDALFVGTWTVREHGKVWNRLHWVRPDGTLGHYDKGHTFRMSSEATQLARGTKRETFEWKGWRIRPAVCYDLRFPLWLRNRNLAPTTKEVAPVPEDLNPCLDYDLLLVCANWPASRHEAWTTLLKARAIENQCYVVGVNRVGTDGIGIAYSGNSMVVDYMGAAVAEAEPGKSCTIVATMDKEDLVRFRKHWPFWLDAD
ncbi:MAG: nitrilase-related carbon-nitrogen hydrolase [Bacteroidales bacterium]|nr:nitrilase-related carbon-nitrogen hydrolase [Bacteroidales bacterium]